MTYAVSLSEASGHVDTWDRVTKTPCSPRLPTLRLIVAAAHVAVDYVSPRWSHHRGMNGPPPSTRAFLSDLGSLPADSKVRFLGCVRTYNVKTGHLTLEHNYPRRRPPQQSPSVSVDVDAVLERLTSEALCVGAWVNVVGYVRRPVHQPDHVYIEAMMLFPAGPIVLDEYERILHDSLEAERRAQG
ncbi:telomere capping, CST complex subunit-domain-containing protein [Aspergillus ambiguus]|uniref:nuclear telomere cap complex subunit Ten1 n=1 Tax=Aspergillus ambiguus TaxID=176160 RepID=UPI003CCDD7E2